MRVCSGLVRRRSRRRPGVGQVGEDDVDAYGYGWRVHGDRLWHSGETIGFRNVILRWPPQRLTVVLLSNRNDPEPYATAMAIAAPYLREVEGAH